MIPILITFGIGLLVIVIISIIEEKQEAKVYHLN